MTGQAGSIRLGLARALLLAGAEWKPLLRQKGMLTRDGRSKERKKYGQPGARKTIPVLETLIGVKIKSCQDKPGFDTPGLVGFSVVVGRFCEAA